VAHAGPTAKSITAKANATVTVTGNIGGGATIDLAWAKSSQVACWPAIRNNQFDGKHVLYKTSLPPKSTMVIELEPGANDDLSLYAYSGGGGALPPTVTSVLSCEASYATGRNKKETVELRAIANGYDVVIGVAGARTASRGSFKLNVTLKTAGPAVADTGAPPIRTLTAKAGKTVQVNGSIDGGKVIPLDWAARSSMACWPATRNAHYDGKHVLYKTHLPPKSTMTIELAPGANDDLSLYAYSGGGGALPPSVSSVVSCEASNNTGRNKAEKVELRAIANGYDVVIGVAGARKAAKGSFALRVSLVSAGPGVADTGPPPIRALTANAGKTVRVNGSIDGGKVIPLDWAERSSMACWPANWNAHYDGKHVLYKTSLPPKSTMVIELEPGANADVSLYAYSGGGGALPPAVTSVVSCEATYSTAQQKKQKVELRAIRNGYDVVIGVAGGHKASKGTFQLAVTIK